MRTDTIHALVGKSLRSRAVMANALCALAEEAFHAGQFDRTVETVRSIRSALTDVSILLSGDISYFPHETLRETAGLEERIASIEAAIQPQTIH
jgi:hypothetical protein